MGFEEPQDGIYARQQELYTEGYQRWQCAAIVSRNFTKSSQECNSTLHVTMGTYNCRLLSSFGGWISCQGHNSTAVSVIRVSGCVSRSYLTSPS